MYNMNMSRNRKTVTVVLGLAIALTSHFCLVECALAQPAPQRSCEGCPDENRKHDAATLCCEPFVAVEGAQLRADTGPNTDWAVVPADPAGSTVQPNSRLRPTVASDVSPPALLFPNASIHAPPALV